LSHPALTQVLHRPLEERDAAAGQIHRAPSLTCHLAAPAGTQRTPHTFSSGLLQDVPGTSGSHEAPHGLPSFESSHNSNCIVCANSRRLAVFVSISAQVSRHILPRPTIHGTSVSVCFPTAISCRSNLIRSSLHAVTLCVIPLCRRSRPTRQLLLQITSQASNSRSRRHAQPTSFPRYYTDARFNLNVIIVTRRRFHRR
jgi:hypothetical protein